MKSLEEWFTDYAVCHQHPTNQLIHVICVPAILFSTMGLIWAIPSLAWGGWDINWLYPVILGITIFYSTIDFKYSLYMFFVQLVFLGGFNMIANFGLSVGWICTAVFIVAWVAQFYGHEVEGKKPSFFKDVSYLLIGPLWVLKKTLALFTR